MTKKNLLLLAGGLYHPFETGAEILKKTLETSGEYQVYVTGDRDALLAGNVCQFDAVISYICAGELTPEQERGLVGYVKVGRAYIGLHGATTIRGEHPENDEMLGGRFVTHPPVGEFTVAVADPNHPITQGMSDFVITDELYILDKFDPVQSHILATAILDGRTHPVAYTKNYGNGKVFYLAIGHDERALGHPEFEKMLVRGMDWIVSECS